ncbi:RAP protein, putative [Plasmodium berghei]|uniref:RAP protein, putative n=3 Tax=Plasmodium berghei TaxID=5821 RepID=A0A509ANS9_PLABA|nr:RAP protein, putative [Plasmodium berghei ANKA]CXI83100.1 RAP protein, putative [Plasmodium berghei]SCN27450.1 RAP protein, putative [Plasmodium berghei]SCO62151.1 RAP protein, putative [Plasmodium berghei]SCO63877.1 RAP protein, putative [Plasmodium berghei]VUC57304.1 RAP protein, putative [Plasmodium berghei ANKA]|eukprot:XP_034423082.1 RAP protein, putative [Plasmodium berghei ANKA]
MIKPRIWTSMIFNIIKQEKGYSTKNVMQIERQKVESLILYFQKCIQEDRTNNCNLFNFNVIHDDKPSIKNIHINLVRISYFLKNIKVDENKWLSIYEQISELEIINDKLYLRKKHVEDDEIKKNKYDANNKKKNYDHENKNNIENTPIFSTNYILENNLSIKYNIQELHASYLFVFNTCITSLSKYISLYDIQKYLLILKKCERFFNFFFKLHKNKKGKKNSNISPKLNFLYLYSTSQNYMENAKILKTQNNNNIIINEKDKFNFSYYYEELYKLKYHQIFINKINLIINIFKNINLYSISYEHFEQVLNFLYNKTKNGIVIENIILNFLQYFVKQIKNETEDKNANFKNIHINSLFKVVNIMYYSKIVHKDIMENFVKILKKYKNTNNICNGNIFFNSLKLLTLLERNDDIIYIYKYCKEYIIFNKNPQHIFNLFFFSSIIGLFDLSLINLYISLLKKYKIIPTTFDMSYNIHQNYNDDISKVHTPFLYKKYYTLLGWNIVMNNFVKHLKDDQKEAIEIVKINFNNKNVNYIYSNKISNNVAHLLKEINFLLNFYQINMTKVSNTQKNNFFYNQYTIYTILKKKFNEHSIIYEYISKQNILIDILLILKKNQHHIDYYKLFAIEFNGRTHYNLQINQDNLITNNLHYYLKENYNTQFKKFITSNLGFINIYIPFYKWNSLNLSQKELYLINYIHSFK